METIQQQIEAEVEKKLTLERKKWEDEERRKRQQLVTQMKPIKLNVGGVYFTTSATSLMREPDSMLSRICSTEFAPGDDGAYFIDRDPTVFAVVLDYLRTNAVRLTKCVTAQQLLEEAQYFLLDQLVKVLSAPITTNKNYTNPLAKNFRLPVPPGSTAIVIAGSMVGYAYSLRCAIATPTGDCQSVNFSVAKQNNLPRQNNLQTKQNILEAKQNNLEEETKLISFLVGLGFQISDTNFICHSVNEISSRTVLVLH